MGDTVGGAVGDVLNGVNNTVGGLLGGNGNRTPALTLTP